MPENVMNKADADSPFTCRWHVSESGDENGDVLGVAWGRTIHQMSKT